MKFAQQRDPFVCNYMAVIQICMAKVIAFYVDDTIAFNQDIFWDFKTLEQVRHDAIPMSWTNVAFDLNESEGVEHAHLHFSPPGHSIRAYHQHRHGAKHVTRSIYANIVADVETLCKGKF